MNRYLLLLLFVISTAAPAIVIRSDVEDARYRIPASAFPALADMPGEGHGVLIAPRWVITAAHAAPMLMEGMDTQIEIAGVAHAVERVVIHPGYEKLPDALIEQALATGDASRIHAFLADSDDIALVKLATPVTDVAPVALYRGSDEVGKTIEVIGMGASGNGMDGQTPHSPHRTVLRHAFNVVAGADERWLWYVFDQPPAGLPLEGTGGSGDSGGPVLIVEDGQARLVGLTNWTKYPPNDEPTIQPGLYGQISYNIRISRYIPWIEGVMAASTPAVSATSASTPPPEWCAVAGDLTGADTAEVPAEPEFPPIQLDLRVPFAPTVFPSGGFNFVVYELHFQSYSDEPMALRSLEILNADTNKLVASFTGARLSERLLSIGGDEFDSEHSLPGGSRAVALVCLAFDGAGFVPDKLRHRVLVGNAIAEGPTIGTSHTTLKVLAPPVYGTDWVADNGPSLHSHHRTGIFVAGGRAHLSRRFAIDWKQVKHGAMYSGDARDVHAYYSYGEKVFAVADAIVVSAVDGLPDNIPRTAAGFDTAVQINMDNVAGNAVVLDLGDGQFAYYAHLKPGSVKVKAGDRVHRGEVIGQIGNSGDARWPHLHFQVTTTADILASEGVPFLIERYRAKDEEGNWHTRTQEYPIGDIAIGFDEDIDMRHE